MRSRISRYFSTQVGGDAPQIPIGLEDHHKGLVDVVRQNAVYFHGEHGQELEVTDIPAAMQEQAVAARLALIEQAGSANAKSGES